MSEQDFVLAKKYRKIKNRLYFLNFALNVLFLGFFFFSGISLLLREQAASIFNQIFLINGFYIVIFYFAFYTLNFPLNLYEGFILEHNFNLSNQNFLSWVKDDFKKSALELILFFITVEAVYFFLLSSRQFWWVFAGAFWIFLTLILAKITPAVIIPVFYKYIPITDAELKEKILYLFEKCRIKIRDVASIDFSKKTKKANAFVCGLGKNKKVVLSDTLLNNFTSEEIEVVTSHELGHYINHDILKLIIINSAFTFLGLYLVANLLNNLVFVFNLKGIDDIAFLPVFALSLILLGFIVLPLQNGFSRYLEKRADLFSLKLTQNKSAFISTMEKLARLNLADLDPSRFIEIWLYDHPPIAKRIKFAKDYPLEGLRDV